MSLFCKTIYAKYFENNPNSETYLESSQTCNIELFVKAVNYFARSSIIDAWLNSECSSVFAAIWLVSTNRRTRDYKQVALFEYVVKSFKGKADKRFKFVRVWLRKKLLHKCCVFVRFLQKNPLNIIFPFNLDIFLKATNNVKDKFPYKSSCLAIFREAGEVATLKLTEKG